MAEDSKEPANSILSTNGRDREGRREGEKERSREAAGG